ncbi:MAG: T9SS type A sorting domain-containing protein, partial [Bacteroidota bacterium]
LDPTDPTIVYAALGGFGTDHVYKSTDAGASWQTSSAGLPDVPANTLLVDPLFPQHVYVGNDLGVYASQDGGLTWAPFVDDLPEAVMAMDLSYSPTDRKIWVATHGHGIYRAPLLGPGVGVSPPQVFLEAPVLAPNPVQETAVLRFQLERGASVAVSVLDVQGRMVKPLQAKRAYQAGTHEINVNRDGLATGIYFLALESENARKVVRMQVM